MLRNKHQSQTFFTDKFYCKRLLGYSISRNKSFLLLNVAYIPYPFCLKMLHSLPTHLKFAYFDKTSQQRTPPNSGQFCTDSKVSAIRRFCYSRNSCSETLKVLFNKTLLTGNFPNEMKLADVTPVFFKKSLLK